MFHKNIVRLIFSFLNSISSWMWLNLDLNITVYVITVNIFIKRKL